MLRKLHIDELIIFFLLSIGFLLVSWWTGIVDFKGEFPATYPQELGLNKNLKVYENGNLISGFETYNPNYHIYYSSNGGDSYQCSNSFLNTDDIRMDKIDHYPSSLRWRPSGSAKPLLRSVLVFVVDPKRKIRSDIQPFIIDPEQSRGKVLYITTSQNGLFDDSDGLLVGGKSSWDDPTFYKSWYYRNANYTQRGMDWERLAHVQLVENGEVVFSQKGGLRINGHASRGFTQKSFRFKARKQYDGSKFKFPFFGKRGLKKYESLVIRQSGNDNTETMFADLMMQNLATGSKVLTQAGEPVTVYINGNYWGQYNLRERIDRYMISEYENCKSSEVTIIERGRGILKSGDQEVRDKFIDQLDSWYQANETSDKTIKELKDEISMKSFTDYIFFESYYANNDWLKNNVTMYKVKGDKWKWVLNDLDYSLGYPGETNLHYNAFNDLRSSNTVVGKLFQIVVRNEKAKKQFIDRCEKNIEKYLREDLVQEEFNELKTYYNKHIDDHLLRWRVIGTRENWEDNCNRNLSFLNQRKGIYQKQLEKL